MTNNESLIEEKELSLLAPDVRSSVEVLNQLIADDYIELGSSGKVYDKENIIERLPKQPPVSYEVSDLRVKTLAEDVVLTTFKTVRTTGDEVSEALRSSIWKNNNGVWQIIFHQGTKTE